MPQMSPMMWMTLYIYFLLIYFFIMIILNFMILVKNKVEKFNLISNFLNYKIKW
uniref:ATP synthase F0 subunit 8 n=1 Tax=Lamennaisia ambigua TaxID=3064205 RepID=UPI00286AD3AE|nr:ATP synthase F0 subunit 8 [Lamennaisia ambigua]WKV28902.1 ATP synthase F0 subunit 8 [Lamennaisia ambigua]